MEKQSHPHPAASLLEACDIIPDRPLPHPCPDDESLAIWLRGQSQEKLRELLEAVSRFQGGNRS